MQLDHYSLCVVLVFVSEPTSQRVSIGESIDDLIDDEENIKDAEYLVDVMNESSKLYTLGKWI